MQRIKRVRWPTKNIGGDKSFCKLKYVKGAIFNIATGQYYNSQNQVMNIGAWSATALSACTLAGVMGDTPNLSTMGQLYLHYRIRGIKLRLTYWQTGGAPVILFSNAAADTADVETTSTAPTPDFPVPNITILPEQRWGKYRVCQATAAGGRATTLSAYYSVNKVQGPDSVVRNDTDYVGSMKPATPYFADTTSGSLTRPIKGPWLQFGISTLSGATVAALEQVTGVLKVEQTVYCEFFGKRAQTQ